MHTRARYSHLEHFNDMAERELCMKFDHLSSLSEYA